MVNFLYMKEVIMDKRYFMIFWNYISYHEYNIHLKKDISSLISDIKDIIIKTNDFDNVLMIESTNKELSENIIADKLRHIFFINNNGYQVVYGKLEMYVKEVNEGFIPVCPIKN